MKYREFYEQRIPTPLPSPNENGDVVVLCVFHNDREPSLGINLDTGKWRCYSASCPGHRGGGWKKFEQMLTGQIPGVVNKVEPIDPAIIEAHHLILISNRERLEFLAKVRGITLETVKRFKLGWDSERFWIPVADANGSWVNVRKYKPGATKFKVLPYDTGYNQARLFPIENLRHERVILFEGEMDTILACQLGYPASTGTGGADTWLEEFTRTLEGKDVYLCYDADSAGRAGARRAAMRLLGRARKVYIVRLPLSGTKDEKDFTDYIHKLGHTSEDFNLLLEQAEFVEEKLGHTDIPSEHDVESIHLSAIGEDRLVGKRVKSIVLVAGKDLAPFQVPYKISYQCEMGEKFCDRCGIARAGGQLEHTVPEYSSDLIAMTGVPDAILEMILAKMATIPAKCKKARVKVLEFTNIETIKVIPEIDFSAEGASYVIRTVHYLGNGMETNHTYMIEGVVMPDPKNQYATAIVYRATPSQDSIDKFELTPEDMKLLEIFQVEEDDNEQV